MKKKTLTLLLTITTIAALTACGQADAQDSVNQPEETAVEQEMQVEETQETTPDVEDTTSDEEDATEEYYEEEMNEPSNNFEERVGKTVFDSYDEIIGLLEGEEAYALVNVKGYDGEVLFISDATYDDLLGHIATTDCSVYSMKANGKCTFDSVIYAGGTATPVSIDDEGVIYTAMDTTFMKSCYGDNDSENPAYMLLADVMADELGDNGEPVTVGGLVRTNNSLVEDDGFFLRGNDGDIDIYKEIRDAYYNNTQPISFTRIDGTVAQ